MAIAAGLVIVALTAAAFWLSYAHLAEVALAHGMHGKEVRAWAWPATLDLFIVAGELLMLRAAVGGRGVDWWAVGLTVAGSGGSIALNVAGVGSHAEPLDYVVAAVPPTAALLAFGALMRQIHQALAERDETARLAVSSAPTGMATEVTVERIDDDQPIAELEPRPLPEVVPVGVRVLPLVARPDTADVTSGHPLLRHQWDKTGERQALTEVVIPSVPALESGTFWSATKSSDLSSKLTAAVPAVQPRQVVTQVVTLTPSELRRKARSLNRQAVTSTSRPVTIKALQDELGLSRREATELRREIVEARS
ncbi:DUF2637 domain-containing protein [Streptomyces sp. CAI-85]|nr:DUF2637 domain-containing protein [Streptomyces sp. CAI-85]